MKRILALVLMAAMVAPGGAAAQISSDVWRGFVEKLEPGTELNVRLSEGKRFRAVLVGVRADAVLLQPKTRVTVPVQAVPYDAIASLERRQPSPGMGAAKAAGIGVASGVAVFFAILAIVFAAYDD